MVLTHTLNPIFLDVFGVQIRYYGLFYVIGIIIFYLFLKYFIKEKQLDLTEDELLDLLLYLVIGLLLGARIFYFVFYNFLNLLQNPLSLFAIWQGGMSFHGGLIGIIVAGIIFCKLKKKSFYHLADYVVIPAGIGMALVRIGNFINGELFGRPTSLPIAMDFGDGVPRHPSQLYESAKNMFMFTTLWLTRKNNFPVGFRFWLFVFMYGFLRFMIEFVREPDPQLGFILLSFTMGQLLCSIMILVGGYMLYSLYSKHTTQQ